MKLLIPLLSSVILLAGCVTFEPVDETQASDTSSRSLIVRSTIDGVPMDGPPCNQTGPLVEDAQRFTTGGSVEHRFNLTGVCPVEKTFQLATYAGTELRIAVEGPHGAVFEFKQSAGVIGPGTIVTIGGRSEDSLNSNLPPGEYVYRAAASHVAEYSFTLRIPSGTDG